MRLRRLRASDGLFCEQRLRLRDREERRERVVVLALDAIEHRLAQLAVGHQRRVAGGDAHVHLREHHVQPVDQGAEERPPRVHRAQRREPPLARAALARYCFTAEPKP